MSGLFATLAAAARGDGNALQPRPRGAFEPAPMIADLGQASILDDAADGAEFTTTARKSVSRDADLSANRVDNRNQTTDHNDFFSEVAASDLGLLLPKKNPAGDQPVDSASPPRDPGASITEPAIPNGIAPPRIDAALQRRNAHPDRRTAEGSAIPPQDKRGARSYDRNSGSAIATSADAKDAVLLPSDGRGVDDPATLSPPVSNPTDARRRPSPTRTLTIGRIEVRPPPVAAQPPAPTNRAPAINRAMPRQSLDDYRRRGR